MKVDIWSDIRCPFCYIGKRKFEAGLSQFPQRDRVEVEWHSFELDPTLKTDTTIDIHDFLAKHKGQTRQWSLQMHHQVKEAAYEVGIDFNFDKMVVANSFNAHRLIQLAKKKNLGNSAEEALFRAHFSNGKNIDDQEALVEIGEELGISSQEMNEMLHSDAYAGEVRQEEQVAGKMGIHGVPFFVLNRKYAVSGAQAPELFLSALQQAWTDHEKENPRLIVNSELGDQCSADETCAIK
jgi:predicted DsbA family dithiol-disulfide isomerase